MKTLLIGLLAFCAWSALATYIYVCKIQGLCDAPQGTELLSINNDALKTKDTLLNLLVPAESQLLESMPNSDTLEKTSEYVKAKLPEDLSIYFAFDKSEFNADLETEKYFVESNDYLKQNPQATLSITGYTDAVGSDQYNQVLGTKRAQSVEDYFEQLGMPLNKMNIASKGEKEPAENNATAAGRSNNRRTEITIKK